MGKSAASAVTAAVRSAVATASSPPAPGGARGAASAAASPVMQGEHSLLLLWLRRTNFRPEHRAQATRDGLLLTHESQQSNFHVPCTACPSVRPCSAQGLPRQGAHVGVRAASVPAAVFRLHAHAHAQQHAEQVNCIGCSKPARQPARACHRHFKHGLRLQARHPPFPPSANPVPYCTTMWACGHFRMC